MSFFMVFEDYHRATIWRFQPNLLFQFDFCLDQFTKTFTSSPNNVIVRWASSKFKFSLWASIWVILPSKSVLVVFWNSCVLCYSKWLPIQSHLFSHYLRTSSGWYVRLTYQQQGSIEDEPGRPPPPRLPPAPPSTVEASPSSNLSDQHLVDSHLSAHTQCPLWNVRTWEHFACAFSPFTPLSRAGGGALHCKRDTHHCVGQLCVQDWGARVGLPGRGETVGERIGEENAKERCLHGGQSASKYATADPSQWAVRGLLCVVKPYPYFVRSHALGTKMCGTVLNCWQCKSPKGAAGTRLAWKQLTDPQ